eukprot:CAMPEP_0196140868 /NCGR_PEP_ID=MMETSP0910-20130528/7616_1 /TAXON_ID=49265 /ORGANISM="Thalassiosira rotula, Strain GSO102" /LENGTH=323 /DNA_ID=CAMNT_0041401785 /DNA_START=106 /DNA_END=1077 /DNA_ORIENTATION=-
MSSHHYIDFVSALRQDVALTADSLVATMEQECTVYSCRDYLADSCHDDENSSGIISNREHHTNRITSVDRLKIVDWCYGIVDQFQCDRETVAIAMNIADRFAGTNPTSQGSQENNVLHNRSQYQLIAITALHIAIKLNAEVAFGSENFTVAIHGTYTVADIEDMEIKILHGLSWRMCPPTSLQVGYQVLSLLLVKLENRTLERGTWEFLRDEVAFQTESAVRDYYFTTQRPSTTAIAAIMNAIEQVNQVDYEHLTTILLCIMEEFAFDSSRKLLEAREHLQCIVNENEENDSDTVSVTTRVSSLRSHSTISNGSSEGSCLTMY